MNHQFFKRFVFYFFLLLICISSTGCMGLIFSKELPTISNETAANKLKKRAVPIDKIYRYRSQQDLIDGYNSCGLGIGELEVYNHKGERLVLLRDAERLVNITSKDSVNIQCSGKLESMIEMIVRGDSLYPSTAFPNLTECYSLTALNGEPFELDQHADSDLIVLMTWSTIKPFGGVNKMEDRIKELSQSHQNIEYVLVNMDLPEDPETD